MEAWGGIHRNPCLCSCSLAVQDWIRGVFNKPGSRQRAATLLSLPATCPGTLPALLPPSSLPHLCKFAADPCERVPKGALCIAARSAVGLQPRHGEGADGTASIAVCDLAGFLTRAFIMLFFFPQRNKWEELKHQLACRCNNNHRAFFSFTPFLPGSAGLLCSRTSVLFSLPK